MALDRRPVVGVRDQVVGRRGASKAQAALAKIIAVISTIPPPVAAATALIKPHPDADSKAVAGVDLSLRLGPKIEEGEPPRDVGGFGSLVADPVTTADDESVSPAESVAGNTHKTEKSSEGEDEEDTSEITNVASSSATTVNVKSECYLDLLLEAAEQELEAKQEMSVPKRVRSSSSKKRPRELKTNWSAFDFHEVVKEAAAAAAPLVRSTRGRNQTLPSRYRDSILEPWMKPPTVSRQRRDT